MNQRDMRCSDHDRQQIIARLSEAYAEGRLDLAEFEQRQGNALAAMTYGDLDRLIGDLPRPDMVRSTSPAVHIEAGFTSQQRTGPWEVPQRLVLSPTGANIKVDFTEAVCAFPRVDVHINGGLGRVVLLTPTNWGADLTHFRSAWGKATCKIGSQAGADGTVLVLSGGIGMGSLAVRPPRKWGR